MEKRRKKALVEIQELFNAINKNVALDWAHHDETGLSLSHVCILEMLASEGAKRPSDLAEMLQITTGGITSLSHRLTEGSLVKKVSNEKDRRAILLEVTEKGKDVLKQALGQRENMMDRLFGSLSDTDIDYLKQIGYSLLHQDKQSN